MSQIAAERAAPAVCYYALLPHPTSPRLLLLPAEHGWSPPHWSDPTPHFWQSVAHVNAALRQRLGLEVTTLRCLLPHLLVDQSSLVRVYALENHSPAGRRPLRAAGSIGARWIRSWCRRRSCGRC